MAPLELVVIGGKATERDCTSESRGGLDDETLAGAGRDEEYYTSVSCEPPGFCLFDWRSAVVVVLGQILVSFLAAMCESKLFSHDQSLCHELVQAFSKALSLKGDRRHRFKHENDRSPSETLLSPVFFFFLPNR